MQAFRRISLVSTGYKTVQKDDCSRTTEDASVAADVAFLLVTFVERLSSDDDGGQ